MEGTQRVSLTPAVLFAVWNSRRGSAGLMRAAGLAFGERQEGERDYDGFYSSYENEGRLGYVYA